MNLVFYDTETTGINTNYDQIVQFAAIRTDGDLNESVRFNLRSRLLPYVVPSPYALQVTGLTIDDLLNPEHLTHYEMVRQIREKVLLGWGPTVHVAYNGLRFDEEILRQALYQTCHAPFITNTNQNTRADALSLVQTAAVLHPGALTLPINDKGRPVFKLDQLAPANGYDHSEAHDALADVEATIFLARLVQTRCPDVWQRWLQFASKLRVNRFLTETPAFLLIQPAVQAAFVVAPLGSNPDQPNLTYAWDLSFDPRSFTAMTDEELLATFRKKGSPVRRIKINNGPSMVSLEEAPLHLLGDTSPEVYIRRGEEMARNREFALRVIRIMAASAPVHPKSEHMERRIYDGFWSRQDELRLGVFHSADWCDRVHIAEELEDPRLLWLARRLIWLERPELCAQEHADTFSQEKARRLLATEGGDGWNTLQRVTDELEKVLEGLHEDAVAPFHAYGAFLASKRAECEQVLGGVGSTQG